MSATVRERKRWASALRSKVLLRARLSGPRYLARHRPLGCLVMNAMTHPFSLLPLYQWALTTGKGPRRPGRGQDAGMPERRAEEALLEHQEPAGADRRRRPEPGRSPVGHYDVTEAGA